MTVDRRGRAVDLRRQGLDGEGVVSPAGNQLGRRGVDPFGRFASAIPSDQPVVAWHLTELPWSRLLKYFSHAENFQSSFLTVARRWHRTDDFDRNRLGRELFLNFAAPR
jgi:hypothetical protein